jgi:hypothetical protein
MIIRTTALSAIALAVSLTAGCSSHDEDHHDRSHDRIETRRPDYPPPGAGPVYTDRGVREIPRDAIRLEKDEGPEMRVRPEREGRIFLYDERDGRIAYEGQLHPKEEFVAIPERNEVTIDGRRVEGVRLDPHARYQLYYLRD